MPFRPVRRRALAGALLVAAAVPLALSLDGPATAQGPGERTLTFNEKVQRLVFVPAGAKRPFRGKVRPGDRVQTVQSLSDPSGASVGKLYTDCVASARGDVFQTPIQCTTTYKFADGQLVAAGVITLSDADTQAAIVGGTGAYAGASGYVSAGKPPKGFDSTDILHITG